MFGRLPISGFWGLGPGLRRQAKEYSTGRSIPEGSLTTPPCSEGVRWFVMEDIIELSKAQIEAFTSILHDNNRPTQPLHGRRVGLVR